MKIKNILLITGNEGKANELKKLIDLKELVLDYKSLSLPEIQSLDIEEIGRYKTMAALEMSEYVNDYEAVLTDDTGFYCDALNGLPGPLVKWFLDRIGAKGIFELVKAKNTSTSVICLLSLGLISDGTVKQFKGQVFGNTVEEKGRHGFGWDGIFKPRGHENTYGEMAFEEKNKISHRALAIKNLRQWLIS